MDLEPVLLEAPLRAILDRLALALRARIERNELLFELSRVAVHVLAATMRISTSRCLALQNFFQRAHLVFTLADVKHFVVRRHWNLIALRRRPIIVFGLL